MSQPSHLDAQRPAHSSISVTMQSSRGSSDRSATFAAARMLTQHAAAVVMTVTAALQACTAAAKGQSHLAGAPAHPAASVTRQEGQALALPAVRQQQQQHSQPRNEGLTSGSHWGSCIGAVCGLWLQWLCWSAWGWCPFCQPAQHGGWCPSAWGPALLQLYCMHHMTVVRQLGQCRQGSSCRAAVYTCPTPSCWTA